LKVESWQISAIVHDENKEFSNLCDNISSPEFPSIRSLLKNRMNLKSDVLQELYGQLSLNGESPVSVLVICQLDKIFEDQPNMNLRDTWKNSKKNFNYLYLPYF
jgi:hypothetical protein